MATEWTFEKAMARLEQIVAALESGRCPLDDSMKLFEEGTRLTAYCAKQLQEAGTNPFEQEMDLVHHYKLHNLDKIIAAETQKAVEAALKNQKSSTQFSTQPSKTQGKESTGTEQIDTMAKFDRFLMGLK
jgi:exodeoxyribonuclease VII small subunit